MPSESAKPVEINNPFGSSCTLNSVLTFCLL